MATIKAGVEVVLGTGTIGDKSDVLVKNFYTPAAAQEFLNLFRKYGHTHLDTARAYSPNAPGTCEPLLGQTDIREWAQIDSKIYPLPHLKKERIQGEIDQSLKDLKIPKVNIEYLHGMDWTTPFEETAEAINDGYRAGKFEKFGLSNASASEVEQFVQICDKHGWIKPTVYQGQYNAIARRPEEDILPTLRRHGISFYAWSPAAGGMFSGNVSDGKKQGTRGDDGSRLSKMHRGMYHKDALIDAASRVTATAREAGITGHAVALRWLLYHSALSGDHGDAIVIGASSLAQLEANMKACAAGPLPDNIVRLVEEVWKPAKEFAPPSHF